MPSPFSNLACLRRPLMTPIQVGTNWIGAVNPMAGRFRAPQIAEAVQGQVGRGMALYTTSPDPVRRVRDIRALISEKSPSLRRPMGLLAFGGDRTLNDSLASIVFHTLKNPMELVLRPGDRVVDQMIESGIQFGPIPLGGANDIGLNYGAPSEDVSAIMDYMDNASVTCLNMGLLVFHDAEKEIPDPQIFCHSVSAGETISPVYEKTTERRGIWAKRYRELLFFRHIISQKSFHAHWKYSDGTEGEAPILETILHASIRGDELNGFTGTPQPGLGVKLMPAKGFWNTMRIFREVLAAGMASRKSDPSRLLPDSQLASLAPEMQHPLQVGESVRIRFRDKDGKPYRTCIQANGDYVARSSDIEIFAVPPFPHFLVREGSLMANLHNHLASQAPV